jgi:hypothetical protein
LYKFDEFVRGVLLTTVLLRFAKPYALGVASEPIFIELFKREFDLLSDKSAQTL